MLVLLDVGKGCFLVLGMAALYRLFPLRHRRHGRRRRKFIRIVPGGITADQLRAEAERLLRQPWLRQYAAVAFEGLPPAPEPMPAAPEPMHAPGHMPEPEPEPS